MGKIGKFSFSPTRRKAKRKRKFERETRHEKLNRFRHFQQIFRINSKSHTNTAYEAVLFLRLIDNKFNFLCFARLRIYRQVM